MDNGNVAALDLEHNDISISQRIIKQRQTKNIAAIKTGLHTTTQNDNDGGLGLCADHQPFPHHER